MTARSARGSYFDAAVTYDGPGTTPARRDAFLRHGPRMIEFLERAGMKFIYADGWSDYYDDLPGGEPRGRSLIAELFDTRELGDWEPRLSRYKGFAMPVPADQFTDLMLVRRTMKGKRRAAALAWRLLKGKLTGSRLAGAGAAIQGRMLQIALREEIPVWTESPVTQLIVEGANGHGRAAGVVVERDGKAVRVGARRGVLLNVGGFARNAAMRERFHPRPSSAEWTNANPGDTGEVIEMAMALGAAVDCMDEAWWVVTSLGPDGKPPRPAAMRPTAHRCHSCTTSICRCRTRSWSTSSASASATRPARTWRSASACTGASRPRAARCRAGW